MITKIRETVKLCRRASTPSKRTKNEKVGEGPKICRREFNFEVYTKKIKKEGEGSKYVGEHWPCDNWIKNEKKKGDGQIMSESVNPIKRDKKWRRKKVREGPQYVGENWILMTSKKQFKKRGKGQKMSENIDLVIIWYRILKKKRDGQLCRRTSNPSRQTKTIKSKRRPQNMSEKIEHW